MIPKEIIELAIQGGWKPLVDEGYQIQLDGDGVGFWYPIALDPTFWQALGKSLGWAGFDAEKDNKMIFAAYEHYHWSAYTHRFYDLLLQKQDTAPFWEEILANVKKV